MDALATLPTEILINIFSQKALRTDQDRIKRVCRRFYDVSRILNLPLHYNFRVDAFTHPTWKLIRFLLSKPEAGEKFGSIRVQWQRRNVRMDSLGLWGWKLDEIDRMKKMTEFWRQRSKTAAAIFARYRVWTRRWEWTPDEVDAIKRVAKTWKLSAGNVTAIFAGINSEALIPLLLCFTPNLESLDMGKVDCRLIRNVQDLVKKAGTYDALPEFFQHLGEYSPLSSKKGYGHLDLWQAVRDDMNTHQPKSRPTWFHQNLVESRRLLPGLVNLRHFGQSSYTNLVLDEDYVHYNDDCDWDWEDGQLGGRDSGIGGHDVFPIFFLPQIETIGIKGCVTGEGTYHEPINSLSAKYKDSKSTVKDLMLVHNLFYKSDYITIAKATGMLEYLYIDETTKKLHDYNSDRHKKIQEVFRNQNKNTLVGKNIIIEDSVMNEEVIVIHDEVILID
ncbi:hypothetical protein ABW20_dc0107446 [Dactylellina cionopaga]|nr:hypothetical protein ABW20_dc0107446 [Dactylellina cionopaga]